MALGEPDERLESVRVGAREEGDPERNGTARRSRSPTPMSPTPTAGAGSRSRSCPSPPESN
jgi:hypothetical protein